MLFRKSADKPSKQNPKTQNTSIKDLTQFFRLGKRQKIIIAAVLITLGLIISTQNTNFLFQRYRYLLGLSLMAYMLSLWALWGEINRLKAVVLMILPTMFTLGVASFYFLLPIGWQTRLPVAALFGFSFYSLLLSQNVFNISANRTIPLYRAASTVSFLFTLITAFFLYNVIYAFNLPFYLNALSIFIISFPLVLQILWSVEMEGVNSQVIIYSVIIALLIAESALALSFWPVAPTIWSIFLATHMYLVLGVITEYMRDRLGKRVIFEFLGVGGVVLIISFLATSWGG